MALTRATKEALLAEYKEALDSAQTIAFVTYNTLSVAEADTLRSQLREEDVTYRVVKKTLFKRALADSSFEGEVPALDEEVAIAYGDDLIAPARGVHAFGTAHDEKVELIGGIFDGVYKSAEEMQEIATIPDLHTLRGMFVNVINAPIQGFVSVLHQVAEQQEA